MYFRQLCSGISLLCVPFSGACDALFFQPNQILYDHPRMHGMAYEDVFLQGSPRLHGWFLPAQGRTKGVVIQFHGNAANLSNHFALVRWLPAEGYAVFLFDYRGYGRSEGEPDRWGAVEDGVRAIRYVRGRADLAQLPIVVLGQSLGGALSCVAIARAGLERIHALVIEGGFLSYREEARHVIARNWIGWPLQYPLAYGLFTDRATPAKVLPQLAALPLLVIHSENDRVVPLKQGRALFDAFPGLGKTFWLAPDRSHVHVFSDAQSPWRARLIAWLDARMPSAAATQTAGESSLATPPSESACQGTPPGEACARSSRSLRKQSYE